MAVTPYTTGATGSWTANVKGRPAKCTSKTAEAPLRPL